MTALPTIPRRILAAIGFVVWCGVAVEGLLWASSRTSPAVASRLGEARAVPGTLPDPVLGRVGNPAAPDHDARGFRNAEALERAAIVTLGDSQTMGFGVRSDESWPAHLARATGASVYNMGIVDTGPVYYHHLLDEALAVDPEWVVTGFYLGNDLWNVLRETYVLEIPRGEGAIGEDPARAAAVRERSARYETETRRHMKRRRAGSANAEAPSGFLRAAAATVREHSRTWRALSAIRDGARRRVVGSGSSASRSGEDRWRRTKAALAGEEGVVLYEEGGLATVLDPGYWILGMDVEGDPLLGHGLDLALEWIDRIDARVERAGARHLVVVIPSKEALFSGLRDPASPGAPGLERVAAAEERIRTVTAERLDGAGVDWVDARPEMRAALERGIQIFPRSIDSHPNGAGYTAIAEAVRRGLAERGYGARAAVDGAQ